LGYDIEVAIKSRRFMFEVKGTAEDGTEFEFTESEVNAARRNRRRDAYRIIFVRHVLDPARTLRLLIPNPFSQRGADTYGATRSAPTPRQCWS
jgi:Protein NO VEIN, C-terminal